jgi:hypothetical protein
LRADVERERDVLAFRDVPDFLAVARPPLAPAVRTLIALPVFERDDALRADVAFRRAVVFLRADVLFERAVVAFRADVFRRAVVALRADVFFLADVAFRADVFRRAVVALRADVFRRAVVALRADVFFLAGVAFRVDAAFRAVVFFRADVALRVDVAFRVDAALRAVVFLRADVVLRPVVRDLEPDFARDEADFVSPARARCLLTVRAAISSARSSERPSSFSDSLMCRYWRSRLLLHAF